MERKNKLQHSSTNTPSAWTLCSFEGIESKDLAREVKLDVFLPSNFSDYEALPLLLLNDGQDSENLGLKETLELLWAENAIQPFVVVGVYCGERIQEYGVANHPDFKGRGSRAEAYTHFLVKQLIPWLSSQYPVSLHHSLNAIAGYSLGGLSAVDIAWNHPHVFPRVAAFSGAFWWRKVEIGKGYTDADRILHARIRSGKFQPGMKFWFQAGTHDETADRNNNGIIDAIDDTLDLMSELIVKGYKPYYEVVYHEVEKGRHDVPTWGKAMPHFLRWAFGVNK